MSYLWRISCKWVEETKALQFPEPCPVHSYISQPWCKYSPDRYHTWPEYTVISIGQHWRDICAKLFTRSETQKSIFIKLWIIFHYFHTKCLHWAHLCHFILHHLENYIFAAHFSNEHTFKTDKSTFKSEWWQTLFLQEWYWIITS